MESGVSLGYEVDGSGSIPGVGGVTIFFSLLVEAGPGVHSTSCKMSSGAFSGIKTVERGASHPTSSYYSNVAANMWTLASTSLVGLRGL